MARRLLRTGDYPEVARLRLGKAVETARIAAGFSGRPEFIAYLDHVIGLRSLKYLEQANRSVTAKVLDPVASALPGWTLDTPKAILEGDDAPPIPPAADRAEVSPIEAARTGDVRDLRDLPLPIRRRLIMEMIDYMQRSTEQFDQETRQRMTEFIKVNDVEGYWSDHYEQSPDGVTTDAG